jgi:hypothetical protein
MKGKIDGDGHLQIERKGELKRQICPFRFEDYSYCGQWCPHFGEQKWIDEHYIIHEKDPDAGRDPDTTSFYINPPKKCIEICHDKTLTFTELEIEG